MIIYFLKSATCLALLLFFYHFVLEKEKMHNFNRFYLLGSVVFSFLAPLTTFTTYVKPKVVNIVPTTIEDSFFVENTTPILMEESIDYSQLLLGIYIFICTILLFRFGRNLYKIIKKIRQNEKIKQGKATLVLVEDKILPHTFWNFIFINKTDYKIGKIEAELFTHELTHVTQKHTIDVLFIELLQAVFWVNPLFIFLKKAIQLNHEFLADEKVINEYKNPFQYQHLLLNKASWNNEYYLASNLNYSLTKKRLEMMTTKSSHTKILLKKLAVIPLIAGFIFLFAERVEAQEKQDIIETIHEQPNNQEKLTVSEIYKKYVYRNLKIIHKDKNGNKINKTYDELSAIEKTRLTPPPPLKLKKIVPTQKQFEALKDKTNYAVWIDGKVVENSVLNKYKHTDFARYFNSHVYKNARSKRFPQDNQARLETKKYFEAQNKKRVEKFLKYLKDEYKIEEIVETPKKKEFIDSPIIKNFPSSKQSISNETIFMTTTIKTEKETNVGTIVDIRKKLKDVNALKISYANNDSIKFNANWFITIENNRYYYTFDKNERIARYYKNGKLVNLDIEKEYNKKHVNFEKLKSTGKHYVFKSEKDKKIIDREFSDLGGMYFRMNRAQKNSVSYPENPIKPYVKLRKGDKIWHKKRSELTEEDKLLLPPPPPAPNASKEEILKAKENYKRWKKRTGNDLPPSPKQIAKNNTLKNQKKTNRKIFILISEEGEYTISKSENLNITEPISLKSIEKIITNLSSEEINNTFIFSKSSDLKKFRSKPSKSIEYQDDIEINILKSKVNFFRNGRNNTEYPMVEYALDNKEGSNYKKSVVQLASIFRKYKIKNMTI